MQEAQWQAAKANLVPCRNCQRRFAPDRIGVHERCCKGPKKPPPTAVSNARDEDEIPVKRQYRASYDNVNEDSVPNNILRSHNRPMKSNFHNQGKHIELLLCKFHCTLKEHKA